MLLFRIILTVLFIGYVPGSLSAVIDYCKTIKLDTSGFNEQKIKIASSRVDCREELVPLEYKHITDYFELSQGASPTGGVSYLAWDDEKKEYSVKQREVNERIEGFVSRNPQYNYLLTLAHSVSVKFMPRDNGGVVVSDIIFSDKQNNRPVSFMRDIYFYAQGRYAAGYSSTPVKYTDKNRVEFTDKVVELFESMSIDW